MRIGCLFARLSAAAYAINAFRQMGKLSLSVQTVNLYILRLLR